MLGRKVVMLTGHVRDSAEPVFSESVVGRNISTPIIVVAMAFRDDVLPVDIIEFVEVHLGPLVPVVSR